MTWGRSIRRGFGMFRIAVVLIIGSIVGNPAFASEKKPAAVDAKIIAAYKKLGGEYGTFHWNGRIGLAEFVPGQTPTDPDDLPGFSFSVLPREKLPDAGVPFAIDWSSFGPKNADFLMLVDLKNLAFLDYIPGNITQAGVSVFENFENLKWLITDDQYLSAETIKQLQRLTVLEHSVQSKEELSHIAKLPELKHLSLRGDGINDKGLESLGKLRNLDVLRLSDCPITGAGFKGFSSLKCLHLDCPAINDDGMKAIGALTALTKFHLRSKAVTDLGLAELKHLVALENLDISHTALTDAGMGVFRHLSRLEIIDLSLTQISEKGLADLKACKALSSLKIYGVKSTDAGIADVRQLANLKSLDVRATGLSDTKLAELLSLKKLNELILDEKQATIKLLKEFRSAGKLYTLTNFGRAESKRAASDVEITTAWLYGTTDVGIEVVKDLKNLEVLWLSGPGITDIGMEHLKGLQDLRELDLCESKVTKVGLGKIARLKKLATLNLNGTPVTDDAVEVLKTMRSLKVLNLNNTKITDARMPELAELETLQTLHIQGETQVTDRLIKAFREKGKRHVLSCFKIYYDPPPRAEADITYADLASPAITDRGLIELGGLKNLTGISLGNAAVTDAGLATLKEFENLTSLNLAGTSVTGSGLRGFPYPLKFKSLGLSGTKLTARSLLEIHRFENLTSLDLRDLRFNIETYNQLQRDVPFCEIFW